MNPCIPIEFFSSTQFVTSDWEVDVQRDSEEEQYPHVPDGAYSRLKVLPLQVVLLQQLLENPSLVSDVELPTHVQDFLLHHFSNVGLLKTQNLGTLAQNAETLDLSFLPDFESSIWLSKLSSCSSLTYVTCDVTINLTFTVDWKAAADAQFTQCPPPCARTCQHSGSISVEGLRLAS